MNSFTSSLVKSMTRISFSSSLLLISSSEKSSSSSSKSILSESISLTFAQVLESYKRGRVGSTGEREVGLNQSGSNNRFLSKAEELCTIPEFWYQCRILRENTQGGILSDN